MQAVKSLGQASWIPSPEVGEPSVVWTMWESLPIADGRPADDQGRVLGLLSRRASVKATSGRFGVSVWHPERRRAGRYRSQWLRKKPLLRVLSSVISPPRDDVRCKASDAAAGTRGAFTSS